MIDLKIDSFRPLYFHSPLKDVVSPPYDTISPEQSRDLLSRPHNIFHLSRQDNGREAESIFQNWIQAGILKQMNHDVMIILSQEFNLTGTVSSRLGVIGIVDTQDAGQIIPHEETFENSVRERRNLMLSMGSQIEPIFLATESSSIDRVLRTAIRGRTPYGTFEEPSGVKNGVYCIDSEDDIRAIRNSLSQSRAIVADGHHRLKATRDIFSMTDDGKQFWRYSLSYVTSFYNDSLLISGIHRILPHEYRRNEFISGLSKYFHVSEFNTQVTDGDIWIYNGRYYQLRPIAATSLSSPEIVNDMVLPVFGIRKGEIESKVSYQYNIADAVSSADRNGGVAIILPQWNKGDFIKFLENGHLLPQKSTYFYPKIPSGIAIYSNLPKDLNISITSRLENPERC